MEPMNGGKTQEWRDLCWKLQTKASPRNLATSLSILILFVSYKLVVRL